MIREIHTNAWKVVLAVASACLIVFAYTFPVAAITPLPTPQPQPGSYGLEAVKKQPPPTVGATITTPGSGASFSSSPITVSGICPNELLVQIYNNGVMAGSVMCENGSFRLEVGLFPGINELSAMVYDWLDQAGPASNTVTVNYTDTNFAEFGQSITLTSAYGRRSATTGAELAWPLQLSGGTGPYAFSIDWSDGKSAELKSQSLAGLVTTEHTYKKAGIYPVNIKVTDVKGVSAFLQVTAVANGKVDSNTPANKSQATGKTQILWIPAAISLALLIPSFWLGRRSQLVSIRNKMLRERAVYNKQK
jgi:hypothetical protein